MKRVRSHRSSEYARSETLLSLRSFEYACSTRSFAWRLLEASTAREPFAATIVEASTHSSGSKLRYNRSFYVYRRTRSTVLARLTACRRVGDETGPTLSITVRQSSGQHTLTEFKTCPLTHDGARPTSCFVMQRGCSADAGANGKFGVDDTRDTLTCF